MSQGLNRPIGGITTLLDLTPRDYQDGEFFPLAAEETWWLPPTRRIHPYSLSVQQFPFRGPAAFGQRFTFDLKSVYCGDLLFSTMIQIQLGHWLDDGTLNKLQNGTYTYPADYDPWYYANSLGSVILERAEFEVNDQTLEIVDGDFLNCASILFADINNQYGLAADGLGTQPSNTITSTPSTRPFPTQNGTLFIPIPFFFQRVKLQESFPLLACKEGSVRIHVTLRPFQECIRRLSGRRQRELGCETASDTPLNQQIPMLNGTTPIQIQTGVAIPQFKNIQLITYSANTDGSIRQKILRAPFENLSRTVNTFTFDEPLKYRKNKIEDLIQVQLPIEVNNPMEEIIWFIRRKEATVNNEWTNYSSVINADYDPIYNPRQPLLHSASIQFNGIELINESEQWFRQHIASVHKGGIASFSRYIYGYSFSKTPAQHQPSGTANASRIQNITLTLNVRPPTGSNWRLWEVKVFVITLEWFRFQDGLANKMFSD